MGSQFILAPDKARETVAVIERFGVATFLPLPDEDAHILSDLVVFA